MNREEVHLFQQQPAAWAQGVDHPTYRMLRFQKMVEQPASVHEVKAILRGAIDCDIMPYSLKVGQFYILEQLDINVGSNDSAS
jgi:hypothetical protein